MRCSCRACSPLLRQFSLEPLHPFLLRVPSQPIAGDPSSLPVNPFLRLVRSDWRVALALRRTTHEEGYLGLAALCWPGKGTTDILAELIALIFFLLSFFLLPKGFIIIITIIICVLIACPFLGQGETGKKERR